MKTWCEDMSMLEYGLAGSYSNIFLFTTTRHGGCSEGNYAAFNCSPFSGDNPGHVLRNQKRLISLFPQQPDRLVIPKQTHSTEIVEITTEIATLPEEELVTKLTGIDALITNLEGICICISTADCVPVLLYDTRNSAVAAIHAGWRGTVDQIVEKTIKKMKTTYGSEGKDMVAVIGPSISPEAFEVGNEVVETFLKKEFPMDKIAFFNEKSRKHHINLWEANKLQLTANGIPEKQIEVSGICTYNNPVHFYSARRLGIASGRILSGIMLLKNHV